MNMKSMLLAATAALTVGLHAEVTANNTLCRIKVDSAATSIIVAVPLVAVGTGSNVAVTDYIMTTNLKDGDSILKWNATDSKWDGWVISSGAWSEMSTVDSDSNVSETTPAADSALARGAAVWLNRSSETISASKKFYLYGQVASGSVTLTATAGGYTLLGNPKTSALDLSELTWSNCAEGDQIIFASESSTPRIYVYKDSKWCKIENTEQDGLPVTTWTALTTGEVTLAPGTGFWYKSVGTTSSPTVTISE